MVRLHAKNVMIDGGLSKIFREHLTDFHWQRVETGGTGLGIPDMNYCCRGFEGWIEFKLAGGWRIELRPEQYAWISRRLRAGGNVFIAVRRKDPGGPRRGAACDDLYLYTGSAAQALMINGLQGVEPLGVWPKGPARWPWSTIANILTTPCNH